MVEVDIHKIWKIFGVGGLIEKLGPDRTIRELKKRCEAGAIVGCSLYRLLIEKWIDVSTEKKEPGYISPLEEFMQSAGEYELVKQIEDLHAKYPDGIPRSIRMDLKDEWNENLERKIGRRIPVDPKDVSKKDKDESKKIVEALAAGVGLPRPLKPKFIPEKEEQKQPEQPRPAAPEEVPQRPIIVKKPEQLELMKKEIEEKINAEKRRRARGGGGMAGESAGEYTQKTVRVKAATYDRIANLGTFRESFDDVLQRLLDCYERIPEIKEWLESISRREISKVNILRESDSSDYKSQKTIRISLDTYVRLSNLGTLADTYDRVIVKILDACEDVLKGKKKQIEAVLAREGPGEYKQDINPKTLRRKEIAHLSKDIEDKCVPLGYLNLYSLFPKSRFGTDTAIVYDCRNVDISKLKRDTIARGENDIIIATSSKNYLKLYHPGIKEIIIGELNDDYIISDQPLSERVKAARAISATAAGPSRPTAHPLCTEIPGFVFCPTCLFKYSVSSVRLCPLRPEPTRFFRESSGIYSEWTYDDFKVVINQITNIENLTDLAIHIDESGVMKPGDKVSARQLIEKRKMDIIAGTPEIRKQIEEQKKAGQLATIQYQDDIMMPDHKDYSLWTFGDFESLLPGIEDVEDLEEMIDYVDLSDKISDDDKETLRSMITSRKTELIRMYTEISGR